VFSQLVLHARARYPFVYLLTWEEDRALRGLREAANALSRPLFVWSALDGLVGDADRVDLPSDGPDTADPVALLEHLAEHPGPALFVLRDFHTAITDPAIVRRLRSLVPTLGASQQTLVLLSPFPAVPRELEKDIVTLDLPLPGLKEVARLFHSLLQGEGIEIELDLFESYVKAALGLTEDEIKRLLAKVHLAHGAFGAAQLQDVVREKAQIIRRSRFLEFHELGAALGDVGGLDNLKEWLVQRRASFSEKARRYGLPQPKGLFLVGVQGCGKSLLAKAVAELWTVPLLRLDLAALLQSGTADDGLRQTVAIAESTAPLVLWVDEIEKAFAGVEAGSGEVASATRTFGSFVTWLQEKTAPVFVVATANDVRNLPPELLRKGRFDEIFFVDLPNVHERQAIFEIHLRKRGRNPRDFDLWSLAEQSEKYSGAEIEQIVVDALFAAFARDRELQTVDLVRAMRDSVPLAVTMDQRIKDLKEWARTRTRPATWDTRRIDFFQDWEEAEVQPE
jgi:AAA+ superfamily predicted ATPase